MSEPVSTTLASQAVQPRAERDDFTFEQLGQAYNYNKISDRRVVFVRLLLKEIARQRGPVDVLDIGCGEGISTGPDAGLFTQAIAEAADVMWGLEPDQSIAARELFSHFEHSTLEHCNVPDESINVAYSFMVMEHVADPQAFFRTVHRVLKPGGTYLFVTPNGKHLFTRLAYLAKHLKVDEWLLRMIRGAQVDDYHYPVQYKCQTPRVIRRMAKDCGFAEPAFAFAENYGMTN